MEDLVDHTRSGVLWYRTNIGGGASDSYKLSTRATQWPSRGHIPAVSGGRLFYHSVTSRVLPVSSLIQLSVT